MPPPLPGERYGDGAAGIGILPGVVQQNFRHLPQVALAAPDGDVRLDVRLQSQPRFKAHRLKGQHRVGHQTAQVHPGPHGAGDAIIHPRQFQQVLHQPPHLPGHGEDVVRHPAPGRFLTVRGLEQLGVGENDGQRGFQLMGCVGHKLALLLPGLFHRPDGPPGQQDAQHQEHREAGQPDENTAAPEILHGVVFAGDVHEHDHQRPRGLFPPVTQMILLQGAGLATGLHHRDQVPEKGLIGQVEVAAVGDDIGSARSGPEDEIGQPGLPGAAGQAHLIGIFRDGFHHPQAVRLQIGLGKIQHCAEDHAQHDRDNGHVDAHELPPEFFQHGSPTSR